MTLQLSFLVHGQLHEVLFGFLQTPDILDFRCIHSKCGAQVVHCAKTQLQDVVGHEVDVVPTYGRTGTAAYYTKRTMDSALVALLVRCEEDIAQVLTQSMGHIVALSTRLFTGAFRIKAFELLLLAVLELVPKSCAQLQLLDLKATDRWLGDAALKLLAAHCSQLQFLDASYTAGRITDESMKVFAVKCLRLQCLNVTNTKSITDESMKLVATHCSQLQSLNISWTGGSITDESMMLVVLVTFKH